MSSKDVVTRPFDAKCLISMGKNLSFSSLLPSVAKPNHLYRSEEDNVDFRLLTDSLATAPDKIFVVFVRHKSTFLQFLSLETWPLAVFQRDQQLYGQIVFTDKSCK